MVTWNEALKKIGTNTTDAAAWLNDPNRGAVEKTQVAKYLGLSDTSAAGLDNWANQQQQALIPTQTTSAGYSQPAPVSEYQQPAPANSPSNSVVDLSGDSFLIDVPSIGKARATLDQSSGNYILTDAAGQALPYFINPNGILQDTSGQTIGNITADGKVVINPNGSYTGGIGSWSKIDPNGEDPLAPPELYQPDKYPKSWSGLDKGIIDQIMPQISSDLLSSLEDFDSNVDTWHKTAVEQNNLGTRDLLKDVLNTSVNQMNKRGILDSSVTSDTIGAATGEVLKNVSNQNLQAGLQAAQLKLAKPDMLGNLAKLGQFTESTDSSVPIKNLLNLFI